MKSMALVLGVALLALSGCGNMPINEELYRTFLTHSFAGSPAKTFNATLAALKELKVGVEKADPAKGLIITERVEFYRQVTITGNQYVATGQSQTATHKYYLKVSGGNGSSTVMAYRYRLWNNGVEQTELNGKWCKENVWDPLFSTIQEKLEEPN